MNDKHVQYILTILKEGSFSAAAKKLFITQPTISQAVKAAETNLGAPIFDRSTDPITLTKAGQLYIDAAHQISEISERLMRQVQEMNNDQTGTLRLGIAIQRAVQLIPKLYPIFSQKYPHVKLQLCECGSVSLESLVIENQVDIACLSTMPKNIHLEYSLIQEEYFVLLANPACELAKRIPNGTPIDISEAKNECFIYSKAGHAVGRAQQIMFRTRGMRPAKAFETERLEVGKATVNTSPVVMMCPNVYAESNGEHKYYVYPLINVDTPRHFYACYKKDVFLTGYMKGLLQILRDVAGETDN